MGKLYYHYQYASTVHTGCTISFSGSAAGGIFRRQKGIDKNVEEIQTALSYKKQNEARDER